MKSIKISLILSLLLSLLIPLRAFAAAPIPGPKGGRILNAEAPFAEFYVEKDHTVSVIFYDAAMKALAPGDQVVSLIAEAKGGKSRLAFTKATACFVSQGALPKGDDYNIVVQIKASADSTPKNYRVYFEDDACEKCHRPQYACICEQK